MERSGGNARLGQSLPLRRFRHDPHAPHRTLSLTSRTDSHSYAFNCDGLTTLQTPQGQNWGAHTQIWNGANGQPVPPASKLIEASSGQRVDRTMLAEVGDVLNWDGMGRSIYAATLWDYGAGYIRMMPEMPL